MHCANAAVTAICKYSFSVRVRYAPSPTGHMHIGALRTAFYNYLFAKKHQGQFIVRIEDTDQHRNIQGSAEHILDILDKFDIRPDESPRSLGLVGPYIQSERLASYKQIQKALLKNNLAYPCFCDQPPTKIMNEVNPYPGTCKQLSLETVKVNIRSGKPYCVRLRSTLMSVPSHFTDEVYGSVVFTPFDDFVIVKRDGWPTFHFANVIDDWRMGITHVIRGEEWLTNTSKHIYLYKLLNAPIPIFAHLPLIQSIDGRKLSKRDPHSSIISIIQKDYEISAMQNMLYRLGLGNKPKEQQQEQEPPKSKQKGKPESTKAKNNRETIKLLSSSEMTASFELSNILRSPVKFDIKTFEHINRISIRKRWSERTVSAQNKAYFIQKVHQYIEESKQASEEFLFAFLEAIIDRLTLVSQLKVFRYFFLPPNFLTAESVTDLKKIFGPGMQMSAANSESQFLFTSVDPSLIARNRKIINILQLIFHHLLAPTEYNEIEIAKRISEFLMQSPELHNEDVFHLLRLMVTGSKNGPNVVKTCAVLGQDEICRRIDRFGAY